MESQNEQLEQKIGLILKNIGKLAELLEIDEESFDPNLMNTFVVDETHDYDDELSNIVLRHHTVGYSFSFMMHHSQFIKMVRFLAYDMTPERVDEMIKVLNSVKEKKAS
jgi:hypothetical protein